MQHILVVDDSVDIRGYLGDILKSAGYHVHEAANGSTVIDLLENNPVDLVVTDIVMPITDGIETIRDVKRRFPDIKIIAASGYKIYLEMAGKLGADRILEKPFDAEKLLVAIRMLLRPGRPDPPFVGARVPHASRPDQPYRPKRGAAYAVREKIASLSKVLVTMGVLLVLAGYPVEADAATITPDDVYRVTGMINGELELLHESNDSMPTVDVNAPELTPRRPRHVLQKAREVLLKVQLLRMINGLPESALPPMPLREVRPADVKKMVDLIEQDIVALRPIFGVTKSPISVPRPSGKRPTDVYANLARATARLDGLGIPRIVPNDVYRVALTIIGDLEKVRSARGLTKLVPMRSVSKDKQPSDVYAKAFELLQALKSLTSENPDFEISGGVVLLNRRSGRLEPSHVMDLLNNILAEISAIKIKVGARSLTEFAPPQAGKTPSHVYDPVSTALVLVETLE